MIGHEGNEAEDIIGTLAARAPGRVAIFSGDRDLFQLVEDPNRWVLYPIRGVSELAVINEAYIENKYGIPGRAYKDFAILRGDPSDGLPGVKGIGEKLATALIARYKNLDAIVEAAQKGESGVALGKVARDLDYLERARKVVAIQTDLPIPQVDLTLRPAPDPERALEEAEVYGLEGRVRDLIKSLSGEK
jgi:5'-3' exonuclease